MGNRASRLKDAAACIREGSARLPPTERQAIADACEELATGLEKEMTDERKTELLDWIENNITDRFPDSIKNLDIGRIRVRIMRLCHEMLGLTDAFPVKDYDPIGKEKELYTMEEFAATARAEITSWHHLFEKNHGEDKKTWSEWMNDFIGYMSW